MDNTRIGDIYARKTDPCLYLEVVSHPGGGLGWYSLIQRKDWPLSCDVSLQPHLYEYLGNGIDDPQLRGRLKRIMEVASWMHQDKKMYIPKTPEYTAAVKEWEKIMFEYKSRKSGAYYNVMLTHPAGDNQTVNIFLMEKPIDSIYKVYFPGLVVEVKKDANLTIEQDQPLQEWHSIIRGKIQELFY